jgi:hypothetical protein
MGSGQTQLRIAWYFVGLTEDRLPWLPRILDQLSVGLLSASALAIFAGSFFEVQAKLEEAQGAITDLRGRSRAAPLSWRSMSTFMSRTRRHLMRTTEANE